MHKEFTDMIRRSPSVEERWLPSRSWRNSEKTIWTGRDRTTSKGCKITDFESAGDFTTVAVVTYTDHGVEKQFEGIGNSPIDAVQRGLEEELGINIKVLDYSEHATTSGSGAQAASYIP